jgi:hypothetical protein
VEAHPGPPLLPERAYGAVSSTATVVWFATISSSDPSSRGWINRPSG